MSPIIVIIIIMQMSRLYLNIENMLIYEEKEGSVENEKRNVRMKDGITEKRQGRRVGRKEGRKEGRE